MFEIDIHLMHTPYFFRCGFRGSKTVKRITLNFASSGLQVLSSWFQRRKDLIVERNRRIDMALMGMSTRLNTW
jgi:hypothetical protein